MTTREQVLDSIESYKANHNGNSPSEREIASLLGISQNTVNYHIDKLIKAGRLLRDPAEHRSLTVLPHPCDTQ